MKKQHIKYTIIFLAIMLAFLLIVYKTNNFEKKKVRKEAVAGSWYPGNKDALRAAVNTYLNNVNRVEVNGTIRAVIVPHAGYSFSGQVAAAAFKQLDDIYSKVIIIGPSHHYPLIGAAIPDVTHYQTPLGEVRLSKETKKLIKEGKTNKVINIVPEAHSEAHAKEHSIEIELPFLQQTLADFELIPILAGSLNPDTFKDILLEYIDAQTLLVISADLSHYYEYSKAQQLDYYTIDRILSRDSEGILNAEIDAPWAVATLLKIAEAKEWKPYLLYYANSGDITGEKEKVVGYAALLFVEMSNIEGIEAGIERNGGNESRGDDNRKREEKGLRDEGIEGKGIEGKEAGSNSKENKEAEDKREDKEREGNEILTKEEQGLLLELARYTAGEYLKTGKKPKINESRITPSLKEVKGCFTTFNKNHNLRGCIGHILPQEELYKCVMDNAVNAAVNDQRFPPVSYEEMNEIKIEVSVLTVPERLESTGEELLERLRPMVDGVVLKQGYSSSTYLPQVWANFNSKEEFLPSLCIKGGMPSDCWKDTSTEAYTYQAFVFGEE